MPKVSCIIPAYNEGKRIGAVLQVVSGHPLLDEVVVVDDGSTDETASVAQAFENIQVVRHTQNEGKSRSVMDGINRSSGDFIFLLDGDLIGLTAKNITDLIEPVVSNQADVSISLGENSPWIYKQIGLDFISGERVFSRKLIQDHLDKAKALPRFGLETYLNKLIIEKKYRIKVILWKNVSSPWPFDKRGLFLGFKIFCLMVVDILKTTSIFGAGNQIIKMTFLKIR